MWNGSCDPGEQSWNPLTLHEIKQSDLHAQISTQQWRVLQKEKQFPPAFILSLIFMSTLTLWWTFLLEIFCTAGCDKGRGLENLHAQLGQLSLNCYLPPCSFSTEEEGNFCGWGHWFLWQEGTEFTDKWRKLCQNTAENPRVWIPFRPETLIFILLELAFWENTKIRQKPVFSTGMLTFPLSLCFSFHILFIYSYSR